ncbi:hypothetical protein IAT38_003409 [Cryptococcus sp. DSM 104549]
MPPISPITQKWLFTEADLDNTPSRSGGISLQDELARRKLTIEHMRNLADRTDKWMGTEDATRDKEQGRHLRGLVTTASIFVQRFFMRRSLVDFDERLVAATVLWIASKVEEYPFKLRFLVNAVLQRFYPHDRNFAAWQAKSSSKSAPRPSEGYNQWEAKILAAEMVMVEALCFDFIVEQPWVVLRRSTRGLDELVKEKYGPLAYAREHPANDWRGKGANGVNGANGLSKVNGANGVDRKRPKVTENVATEVGWVILLESFNTPICLLFPAPFIAFAAFTLVISFIEFIPTHTAIAAASEIGDKFGLDIKFTPRGAVGSDVSAVEACIGKLMEYIEVGLIDEELKRYFVPETQNTHEDFSNTNYSRRFTVKQEGDDVAGGEGQNGVEEAKEGSGVGHENPAEASDPSFHLRPPTPGPNDPSLSGSAPGAEAGLATSASSVRMTQSPVASNPASPSGSYRHSSQGIQSSPPATPPL